MNTSETALIIVDSASVDFSFEGEWYIAQGPESMWQWPFMNASRSAGMDLGGFTFTFEGYDATFVGASRQPVYTTFPNSTITVDPDSVNPLVISFSSPDEAPYYLPWYKTPTLPYGTHRVSVTKCVNEMLNYVLVTVGTDTLLEGKKIFVDDADPQIQYEGKGWVQNKHATFSDSIYTAMPALNTSMQTSRARDSFSLSFLGTSATVYGLFSWTNVSTMTLQFDLDGQSTLISNPVLRNDPNYQQDDQINIPFMSYSNLPPTLHHLTVTVQEISNTSFRFDYVTYTPAFSSLASLSSPQNPNIIYTPTSPPSDDAYASDGQHNLLKIVIGSVLGGLAMLAVAVGGLVFWNRYLNAERTVLVAKRSTKTDPMEPFPQGGATASHILPYPVDKIPEGSPQSASPGMYSSVPAATSPNPTQKRRAVVPILGSSLVRRGAPQPGIDRKDLVVMGSRPDGEPPDSLLPAVRRERQAQVSEQDPHPNNHLPHHSLPIRLNSAVSRDDTITEERSPGIAGHPPSYASAISP